MTSNNYTFEQFASIPCFSFNSDGKRIAIAPNTENVYVLEQKGTAWTQTAVLKSHNGTVYSIDWAKKCGKLATCATDRNAFIWTEVKPNEWVPSLVILRINRAAICIRWSAQENKFAVGTGNKLVCICYYDATSDWWACRQIKKTIRSSVLSLDWHPDNNLIAIGTSDFTVSIMCAAIKEVDQKPPPTVWGDKKGFGAVLCQFKSANGGWIHSVKFSPNGNQLCWVSHDSCISVADSSKQEGYVYVHKINTLPLLSCIWSSESSICAAGYDNKPYLFGFNDGVIKFNKCLDEAKSTGGEEKAVSAMNKFRNMDKFAQANSNKAAPTTLHKNTIKFLDMHPSGKLVSSALDSQILMWNV